MSRTNISPEQIVLSQFEFRQLQKAIKRNIPTAKCKSLITKGLVDEETQHNPGYMPTPTGYAVINQSGLDYLIYVKNQRKLRRSEHLHNWLIAIFSTLAGALLSKPLWTLIEGIYNALLGMT